MSEQREELVRQRAYSLWEADGCPEGQEQEYWYRAVQAVEAEGEPGKPEMTTQPPL